MSQLPEKVTPNHDEIAAKVIDGEAIIMNLRSGVYYSMEGVGAFVWTAIENGSRLTDIGEAMTRRYAASREQVSADLTLLMGELLREKIVSADVSAMAQPPRPADPAEADPDRLPYETPRLEIYRDMGDLLALDPPAPSVLDLRWRK